MAWQNFYLYLTFFCTTLLSELIVVPSLLAQAQPIKTTAVWVSFTPPSGRGIPQNRSGGATRGPGCTGDKSLEDEHFSSLMPDFSKTESDRPSFDIYIPQTVAQHAFFSLRDASEDYYYGTQISLPESPGTYRLNLPADAPSIEPNKKYQWSLSLLCGKAIRPGDPQVGGVIEFVKFGTTVSRQ